VLHDVGSRTLLLLLHDLAATCHLLCAIISTPACTAWLIQRVCHAQVVTEPPNGLRLNLRSSFSRISDATLAECAHPVHCLLMITVTTHLVCGNKHAQGVSCVDSITHHTAPT